MASEEVISTGKVKMASLRVLVVDDDRDNADTLSVLVFRLGCEVAASYDGHSAQEVARTFQPHLALLDLGMPDFSGLKLAQAFRELDSLRTTRLVAVSGFGDDAHRARAREAGFEDFILKPYDLAQLQAVLADARKQFGHDA